MSYPSARLYKVSAGFTVREQVPTEGTEDGDTHYCVQYVLHDRSEARKLGLSDCVGTIYYKKSEEIRTATPPLNPLDPPNTAPPSIQVVLNKLAEEGYTPQFSDQPREWWWKTGRHFYVRTCLRR